jgi:hypothetical protein
VELLNSKKCRIRNLEPKDQEVLEAFGPSFTPLFSFDSFQSRNIFRQIKESSSASLLSPGDSFFALATNKKDHLFGVLYIGRRCNKVVLSLEVSTKPRELKNSKEILLPLLVFLDNSPLREEILAFLPKGNSPLWKMFVSLGFRNSTLQMDSLPYLIYTLYGDIR